MAPLNYASIHPSWRPLVDKALAEVNLSYLEQLNGDESWLPGPNNIFNAFSLSLDQCQFILFGESPYPRQQSANGYAFWDGAVHQLWSSKGLTTQVNRATSLRNFIKMLLIADGTLQSQETSQPSIAAIDKSHYVQSIDDLFKNFLQHGFLLLNASLVLSDHSVRKNAKAWHPFINKLLEQLATCKPEITLLLFGKIAEDINRIPVARCFKQYVAEHPYNISFIHNSKMQCLFKPMHLLNTRSENSKNPVELPGN